jgi:hypothetical protein
LGLVARQRPDRPRFHPRLPARELGSVFGRLPDEEREPALWVLFQPLLREGETLSLSRELRKIPDFPISCPRLQERHPDLATPGGCTCPTRHSIPAGLYPTPLLLAYKAKEIAALGTLRKHKPRKRKRRRGRGAKRSSQRESDRARSSEEETGESAPPTEGKSDPVPSHGDAEKEQGLRNLVARLRSVLRDLETYLVEGFGEG